MHRQLSFQEACARLRIPERRLRDAVKYGEVPCRRQGGDVVFDADALDAWGSARILALHRRDLLPEHLAATRQDAKAPDQDILLPHLLKPGYVDLDFAAKTRPGAIRDLVAKAEALDLLYDPADLLRQLEEREALPHPHHQDPYLIAEPFLILARARRPIWFGAADDAPTDLFCLLCCGENMRHLHVLARLCLMIRETDLLGALRAAATPEEAAEAAFAAERAVLAALR